MRIKEISGNKLLLKAEIMHTHTNKQTVSDDKSRAGEAPAEPTVY